MLRTPWIIFKNKKQKTSQQLEIITYWPETFQNPNTAGVKLVIIEHPIKVQTSHKSSKTIGKGEKVDSNSSFDKKEPEKFLN